MPTPQSDVTGFTDPVGDGKRIGIDGSEGGGAAQQASADIQTTPDGKASTATEVSGKSGVEVVIEVLTFDQIIISTPTPSTLTPGTVLKVTQALNNKVTRVSVSRRHSSAKLTWKTKLAGIVNQVQYRLDSA